MDGEGVVTNPNIAAVVKNSRSRSGSPATCYDMTKFEKEKSPFLAVKSLLKPFKKCRVPEQPRSPIESSSVQAQDWRKLPGMLKPRGSLHSRLKQNPKVDNLIHSFSVFTWVTEITMVQCHKRDFFILNVTHSLLFLTTFFQC